MANAIDWQGNKNYCQNPECPGGHIIHIQIFKGDGYCSVNCKKAQGLDHAPQGTLTFLSREEATMIHKAREKPFVDQMEYHNEQIRRSARG